MSDNFSVLEKIITGRRTIKAAQMNGKKLTDDQVKALLALADWAPTHGRTEPWRFVVYANEQLPLFCQQHADIYKANTTNFVQATYDNLAHMGDKASHLVVAINQRGNLPKIPVMEETAATGAAIEHILLGAEALGASSFWSTGGMALNPSMKEFFQLREEDFVMGFLYLGFTDATAPAVRNTPLEDKITWNG